MDQVMTETTFWNSYLSLPKNHEGLREKLCECEESLVNHRENISKLIRTLSPDSIAILGSGYLTDIPFCDLVAKNRKIYLVDWVENISKVGVSRAIISGQHKSYPECLFCRAGEGKNYCNNFTGGFLHEGTCTGFELAQEPFTTCKNYEPASEPSFIRSDITAGVSRGFAEQIEEEINSCSTPTEAFEKAISITESFDYVPISVEDDSIDLVTSSMVLSQFDVEPYTFFSDLLEKQYGREEILKQEAKLTPWMETLRTRLFTLQVESHVKEMYRIVKKDDKSRVYVSSELFRSFPGEHHYFLVHDMPKAMEILDKYFFYECEELSDGDVLSTSSQGEGVSINQSHVLAPKPKVDKEIN